MKKKRDIVAIDFTEELMNEWIKMYFKQYPRAKNAPIDTPANPSLNKWIILQRKKMNTVKQNYKEFTKFVVKHYGLEDLGISECKCRYIVYKPTKARTDIDNVVPKFILDGLTAEETGVLVDDSCEVIKELTLLIEYRKGVKGARIEFYDCKYDKKLMEATRVKEQAKTTKRKETLEAKAKSKRRRKVR